MPDQDRDPVASTQMFRAFVEQGEARRPSRRRDAPVGLVAAVVVGLLLVAALGWLVLH